MCKNMLLIEIRSFLKLNYDYSEYHCVLSAGANLLSLGRPLLVAVCTNRARYSDPELQVAAALALSKYMLVR